MFKALFCLLAATTWMAAAQPNVLLIVSDDQGYPDLGCIGTKPVLTPNLDKLASEGVRATSFYVTWPACTLVSTLPTASRNLRTAIPRL